MKKLSMLIAMAILFATIAVAQPNPTATASAVTGQVVLADNSIISGTIQDNIRKKGEVIIVNNGKKSRYKAGEINSVTIGGTQYITSNYTFYELVYEGKNNSLLRKANEPSGLQYNGSDAIVVSSTGNVDDLFIRTPGTGSLQLINRNNVAQVLGACATGWDKGNFNAETVKKLVIDCDK